MYTQRFRQHTSLTCMTLLNNSCPLNIAVKSLRKVCRSVWKHWFYCINILCIHLQPANILQKDTDSLDCFKGHVKCDCAHASAFPILVLKNVSPHHHACHAENLLQLLPAHFVVKLGAQGAIWEMVTCLLTICQWSHFYLSKYKLFTGYIFSNGNAASFLSQYI